MLNQNGNVPAILVAVIAVIIISVAGISWYVISRNDNTNVATTNTNTALKNINTAIKNTNVVTTNTNISPIPSDWQTYTNNELGFTFRHPPDTQVNWYPDAVLAGMVRVVSEANPNKNSKIYYGGAGPGPIGIGTYEFQSDLKSFAEDTFSGLLPAKPAEVNGISGFRVQGTLGPNDTRVLGALESTTDVFYVNYNAATWQFAFDAKVEFADQTPSHNEFLTLLETFQFTD